MRKALRIVILLVLILLLFLAAFRHFVTNRVTDRGGMENPDFTCIAETPAQ